MDYTLTNNGAVLMTQVAAGRTILFTRVESGSGYTASPAGLQSVIDKKQDMFLDEVLFENRQATIKTVLSNMQLEEGYQLRQVGVYAKLEGDEADTLVIIGQQYNGEKIPPYGEGIIQIEYDIAMKVSGTGNVTIEGVGTGYVTKGQFQAHLNDHSNPHQVTKKQIGLELVPNVGTDDQTPVFEEAAERENIVSEEKLSVIMGKIRKWFADLRESAFCSVANNLVTMLPGSVLDARQGKLLNERISRLYSEIEGLNNSLLALDTRVTNAITGGSLAAPYSYNVLNYPYSEGGVDGQGYPPTISGSSANSVNVFGAVGSGIYQTYYRLWNQSFKVIGKPTVSWNTGGNRDITTKTLQVLDASTGAILLHTTGASLDLSSLQGKTVKFKQIFTLGWSSVTLTFNSLLLVNK